MTVLTGAMKLLHPYMPFITEEIYQALPHDTESIMISAWPKADPALQDKAAEKGMEAIMNAIRSGGGKGHGSHHERHPVHP